MHKGYFWGGMSFYEFVESIYTIEDKDSNEHFRSQYTFICDREDKLILDFVGKFERLEDDFAEISKRIRLPNISLLNYGNQTEASRTHRWREQLKSKTIEMIIERYYKDYVYFKYPIPKY